MHSYNRHCTVDSEMRRERHRLPKDRKGRTKDQSNRVRGYRKIQGDQVRAGLERSRCRGSDAGAYPRKARRRQRPTGGDTRGMKLRNLRKSSQIRSHRLSAFRFRTISILEWGLTATDLSTR